MKRLFIIIAICVCCTRLQAQAPAGETGIRERMYVATDKDSYIAGELVWLKLVTTDDAGVPLSLSKVGYVEIVDEEESHVHARIELRDGVGEGSLLLPSALPTGWYRLVGYTRWMWNEGSEVFFDKRIGVINPVVAEVPRGRSSEASSPVPSTGGYASPSATAGEMKITAESVYAPRSEVTLDISDIPADIHTLGVTVTALDPIGRFTAPAIGEWKQSLPTEKRPLSGEYEAEYEGALVTGRLVDTRTGETVGSSTVFPLVSFPGNRIDMFGGSLDETGRVVFHTMRATGSNEIVTTMRENNGEPLRIDLDSPYWQRDLGIPQPTFPLDAIDREAMLNQSLAIQLQYSYVNDSLLRSVRIAPIFGERPNVSYNMDEWRRFATMREVITEFVTFVQFSRIDGRRYLSVINPRYVDSRTYSLVLLDGVPVMDHEIIYNYNPLLISRIDVYNDRYMFGNNLFTGIVAFYTSANRYPELQPDPYTQILPYESPQARRLFFSPDYSGEASLQSRIPDYRHTLYWDADVVSEEGNARVSFFTSDMKGRYQVLLEGITASGRPVSAVFPIEVR